MSILFTALEHGEGKKLLDQKVVVTTTHELQINEFEDAFCIVIFFDKQARSWSHYEVRENTLATDLLREFEGDNSVSRTQLTLL